MVCSGRTSISIDQLLPAVPRRIVVQEAALAGEPVSLYSPMSDAAKAFVAVAEEVMRRAQIAPDDQRS